jgi:hypothetical protein
VRHVETVASLRPNIGRVRSHFLTKNISAESGISKTESYDIFDFLSTMAKKSTVFRIVTPCSSEIARRFGGTCHLHLQG